MSEQHPNDSHTALARVAQPPSAPPPASPYAAEHSPPHGAAHGSDSVTDAHYRTRSAGASHAAAPNVPSKKLNTMAVVSFVASLLGWSALPLLGTVVAIITGHMARGEIRRKGEEGDTFAVIGLVLGWAQVALLLGTFVLAVLVFGGFAALMAWLGMSGGGTISMV